MTHGPIDRVIVRKHHLVCRLLKGIYNQRPPQPRWYSCTWDVGLVLDHIRSWGPTVSLTKKKFSLKLAILLALANASRCSELHSLATQYMSWNESGVTFSLAALTKTSKLRRDKALFFPRLEADRDMCPVASLIQYLQRTKSIRRDHTLFISYVKPYGAVQACTILQDGSRTSLRMQALVTSEHTLQEGQQCQLPTCKRCQYHIFWLLQIGQQTVCFANSVLEQTWLSNSH